MHKERNQRDGIAGEHLRTIQAACAAKESVMTPHQRWKRIGGAAAVLVLGVLASGCCGWPFGPGPGGPGGRGPGGHGGPNWQQSSPAYGPARPAEGPRGSR
jgi:hypothetical protein